MKRHFWNIYSKKNSVEVLHDIELLTRSYGFIVDYKKFASDYFILEIEIENVKIGDYFSKLTTNFSIEKYNEISLNKMGDDIVFLNIKIS